MLWGPCACAGGSNIRIGGRRSTTGAHEPASPPIPVAIRREWRGRRDRPRARTPHARRTPHAARPHARLPHIHGAGAPSSDKTSRVRSGPSHQQRRARVRSLTGRALARPGCPGVSPGRRSRTCRPRLIRRPAHLAAAALSAAQKPQHPQHRTSTDPRLALCIPPRGSHRPRRPCDTPECPLVAPAHTRPPPPSPSLSPWLPSRRPLAACAHRTTTTPSATGG
jgi:hypothetical protein